MMSYYPYPDAYPYSNMNVLPFYLSYGIPMFYGYPYPWEMPPFDKDPAEIDGDADLGSFVADPPPLLTDPTPQLRATLFKELSGYPNYGNPSGNADILYTGNRGVWTFNISPLLPIANIRARLLIRAVLDDHVSVPVRRYTARIAINGTTVFNGPLPLQHGSPAGQQFNNWQLMEFNVPNLRRNNRVVIVNNSETNPDDWIGIDWMEMRISFERA